MHKISLPERLKFFLPFIVLLAVLVLLMPRAAKFNFDYRKGSPWKYEALISQFDFPIYKTEEQIREEMSSSDYYPIPYYRYSEDVVNTGLKDAQSMSFGSLSNVKNFIINDLRSIYGQGVVSDKGVQVDRHSPVEVLYIQKEKRVAKYPISEIYKQSDARAKLQADVMAQYPNLDVDSLFRRLGVLELIVPNLVYDQQTTDLLQAENKKEISQTQGYVSSGTLLVSNGEIITAEIAQMLDSYKREYEANVGYSGPRISMWLGNIILGLALVLFLLLTITIVRPGLFQQKNQLYFVLTLFCLAAAIPMLLVRASAQSWFYIVPFTLTAVSLRAFYDKKFSAAIYSISLLPLLIFANDGDILYVMFFLAGLVAIHLYENFGKGWKMFILSFICFAVLAVTYMGFRLTEAVSGQVLRVIGLLFIGSALSVAGYPLTYLFERVFNLVSQSRLEELADTDNKLLRLLESKAPGTFQHCLHVMNMADNAARSIGANVALVRAGALYHDIGKLLNPLCFIENETILPSESAQKYHTGLSPLQSASDIIKHVDDGLELAEQYHLPQIIKKFINTHHGTTVTSYFYNKYIEEGGDPENVKPFSYHGEKPKTKEQVILMLCDSVEAASRTLKENTAEAYSELVENIYASKQSQGQMEEANVSIKEINTIKKELKTYLAHMYHSRVVYPKRKK